MRTNESRDEHVPIHERLVGGRLSEGLGDRTCCVPFHAVLGVRRLVHVPDCRPPIGQSYFLAVGGDDVWRKEDREASRHATVVFRRTRDTVTPGNGTSS